MVAAAVGMRHREFAEESSPSGSVVVWVIICFLCITDNCLQLVNMLESVLYCNVCAEVSWLIYFRVYFIYILRIYFIVMSVPSSVV